MTKLDIVLYDYLNNTANLNITISDINRSIEQLNVCLKHTEIRSKVYNENKLIRNLACECMLYSSGEDFSNKLLNAFYTVRDFLVKVMNSIINFFKRIFNTNNMYRSDLTSAINDYHKLLPSISDKSRIDMLTVFILPKDKMFTMVGILERLAGDIKNMSEERDINKLFMYTDGLKELGLSVINKDIVDTRIRKSMDVSPSRFKAQGWIVEDLIKISNSVMLLNTRVEALENIKNKLQVEIDDGIRKVGRLSAMDKAEDALALQTELNTLSVKSSFIYKSVVILQSYIDQVQIQLISTWRAINEINNVGEYE